MKLKIIPKGMGGLTPEEKAEVERLKAEDAAWIKHIEEMTSYVMPGMPPRHPPRQKS